MRLRGWLWVAALAVLAATGALRLHRGGAIQTDLLAMLPETESNPVAESAIRVLCQATGDRAIFLVGGGAPGPAKAAGRAFAEALGASHAFRHVLGVLPPMDPLAVTSFYAPYRARLPFRARPPTAEGLRALMEARLASPMGAGPGLDPGLDPLGEVGQFLEALPLNALHLEVDEGLLTLKTPEGCHVLVTATLKGSAFDPAVQRESLAAVARAGQGLRQGWPGVEVLRTGTLFYAADARERAEWETGLISWGSLGAMVALFLLVFRSARHLLLGLACVAAGLVAATAVTLLVFGKLYLLTLVCGSSLLGVAVDYPFLYFANQLGAGPAWDARSALRRLLPALLLGVTTTLLGYFTLGVAPFPGLRQMAVFSMAGLGASFLTVLLVLPDLLARPIPARPALMAALGGLGPAAGPAQAPGPGDGAPGALPGPPAGGGRREGAHPALGPAPGRGTADPDPDGALQFRAVLPGGGPGRGRGAVPGGGPPGAAGAPGGHRGPGRAPGGLEFRAVTHDPGPDPGGPPDPGGAPGRGPGRRRLPGRSAGAPDASPGG